MTFAFKTEILIVVNASPKTIGIYILNPKEDIEHFGFKDKEELKSFAKENLCQDSIFYFYTFKKGIMTIIGCGSEEDLEGF